VARQKPVFFIGKPEARKDMLACLFYLKSGIPTGDNNVAIGSGKEKPPTVINSWGF